MGPVQRISQPCIPVCPGDSEGPGSYRQTWPSRSFHKEYFQGRRINTFHQKLDGCFKYLDNDMGAFIYTLNLALPMREPHKGSLGYISLKNPYIDRR